MKRLTKDQTLTLKKRVEKYLSLTLMSMKQFAELCNIDLPSLSQMLSGIIYDEPTYPTFEFASKIANGLGCDVQLLIDQNYFFELMLATIVKQTLPYRKPKLSSIINSTEEKEKFKFIRKGLRRHLKALEIIFPVENWSISSLAAKTDISEDYLKMILLEKSPIVGIGDPLIYALNNGIINNNQLVADFAYLFDFFATDESQIIQLGKLEPWKGEKSSRAKYIYFWQVVESYLTTNSKLIEEWLFIFDLNEKKMIQSVLSLNPLKRGNIVPSAQILNKILHFFETNVETLNNMIDADVKKSLTQDPTLILNSINQPTQDILSLENALKKDFFLLEEKINNMPRVRLLELSNIEYTLHLLIRMPTISELISNCIILYRDNNIINCIVINQDMEIRVWDVSKNKTALAIIKNLYWPKHINLYNHKDDGTHQLIELIKKDCQLTNNSNKQLSAVLDGREIVVFRTNENYRIGFSKEVGDVLIQYCEEKLNFLNSSHAELINYLINENFKGRFLDEALLLNIRSLLNNVVTDFGGKILSFDSDIEYVLSLHQKIYDIFVMKGFTVAAALNLIEEVQSELKSHKQQDIAKKLMPNSFKWQITTSKNQLSGEYFSLTQEPECWSMRSEDTRKLAEEKQVQNNVHNLDSSSELNQIASPQKTNLPKTKQFLSSDVFAMSSKEIIKYLSPRNFVELFKQVSIMKEQFTDEQILKIRDKALSEWSEELFEQYLPKRNLYIFLESSSLEQLENFQKVTYSVSEFEGIRYYHSENSGKKVIEASLQNFIEDLNDPILGCYCKILQYATQSGNLDLVFDSKNFDPRGFYGYMQKTQNNYMARIYNYNSVTLVDAILEELIHFTGLIAKNNHANFYSDETGKQLFHLKLKMDSDRQSLIFETSPNLAQIPQIINNGISAYQQNQYDCELVPKLLRFYQIPEYRQIIKLLYPHTLDYLIPIAYEGLSKLKPLNSSHHAKSNDGVFITNHFFPSLANSINFDLSYIMPSFLQAIVNQSLVSLQYSLSSFIPIKSINTLIAESNVLLNEMNAVSNLLPQCVATAKKTKTIYPPVGSYKGVELTASKYKLGEKSYYFGSYKPIEKLPLWSLVRSKYFWKPVGFGALIAMDLGIKLYNSNTALPMYWHVIDSLGMTALEFRMFSPFYSGLAALIGGVPAALLTTSFGLLAAGPDIKEEFNSTWASIKPSTATKLSDREKVNNILNYDNPFGSTRGIDLEKNPDLTPAQYFATNPDNLQGYEYQKLAKGIFNLWPVKSYFELPNKIWNGLFHPLPNFDQIKLPTVFSIDTNKNFNPDAFREVSDAIKHYYQPNNPMMEGLTYLGLPDSKLNSGADCYAWLQDISGIEMPIPIKIPIPIPYINLVIVLDPKWIQEIALGNSRDTKKPFCKGKIDKSDYTYEMKFTGQGCWENFEVRVKNDFYQISETCRGGLEKYHVNHKKNQPIIKGALNTALNKIEAKREKIDQEALELLQRLGNCFGENDCDLESAQILRNALNNYEQIPWISEHLARLDVTHAIYQFNEAHKTKNPNSEPNINKQEQNDSLQQPSPETYQEKQKEYVATLANEKLLPVLVFDQSIVKLPSDLNLIFQENDGKYKGKFRVNNEDTKKQHKFHRSDVAELKKAKQIQAILDRLQDRAYDLDIKNLLKEGINLIKEDINSFFNTSHNSDYLSESLVATSIKIKEKLQLHYDNVIYYESYVAGKDFNTLLVEFKRNQSDSVKKSMIMAAIKQSLASDLVKGDQLSYESKLQFLKFSEQFNNDPIMQHLFSSVNRAWYHLKNDYFQTLELLNSAISLGNEEDVCRYINQLSHPKYDEIAVEFKTKETATRIDYQAFLFARKYDQYSKATAVDTADIDLAKKLAVELNQAQFDKYSLSKEGQRIDFEKATMSILFNNYSTAIQNALDKCDFDLARTYRDKLHNYALKELTQDENGKTKALKDIDVSIYHKELEYINVSLSCLIRILKPLGQYSEELDTVLWATDFVQHASPNLLASFVKSLRDVKAISIDSMKELSLKVIEDVTTNIKQLYDIFGKDNRLEKSLNIINFLPRHPLLNGIQSTLAWRKAVQSKDIIRSRNAANLAIANYIISNFIESFLQQRKKEGELPENTLSYLGMSIMSALPELIYLIFTPVAMQKVQKAIAIYSLVIDMLKANSHAKENRGHNALVQLQQGNNLWPYLLAWFNCQANELSSPEQTALAQIYIHDLSKALQQHDFFLVINLTNIYDEKTITEQRLPLIQFPILLTIRAQAFLGVNRVGEAQRCHQLMQKLTSKSHFLQNRGLQQEFHRLAVFIASSQQHHFSMRFHLQRLSNLQSNNAQQLLGLIDLIKIMQYGLNLPVRFVFDQLWKKDDKARNLLPAEEVQKKQSASENPFSDIHYKPIKLEDALYLPENHDPDNLVYPLPTLGDGDCFFYAVGKPQLSRASLIEKLLEHARDHRTRSIFATEIFQFLYLGFTGKHDLVQEQIACEQILTNHPVLIELLHYDVKLNNMLDAARRYATDFLVNYFLDKELATKTNQQILELLLQYKDEDNSEHCVLAFERLTQSLLDQTRNRQTIFNYCSDEQLFREYVKMYYGYAKGYFAFHRDFYLGEEKPSTLDIINDLFDLNIQVYIKSVNENKQLTLISKPNNSSNNKPIPILLSGNHFESLDSKIPKFLLYLYNFLDWSTLLDKKFTISVLIKQLPEDLRDIVRSYLEELTPHRNFNMHEFNLVKGLVCFLVALSQSDKNKFHQYLDYAIQLGYKPDFDHYLKSIMREKYDSYIQIMHNFEFSKMQRISFEANILFALCNQELPLAKDEEKLVIAKINQYARAELRYDLDQDALKYLDNKLKKQVDNNASLDNIKELLSKGANPDIVFNTHYYGIKTKSTVLKFSDDLPQTYLLHELALRSRIDLIKLCYEYGATMNIKNLYGMNALEYYLASNIKHKEEVIFSLIERGINPNKKEASTFNYFTPHNFIGGKLGNIVAMSVLNPLHAFACKAPMNLFMDADIYCGLTAAEIAKRKGIIISSEKGSYRVSVPAEIKNQITRHNFFCHHDSVQKLSRNKEAIEKSSHCDLKNVANSTYLNIKIG